MRLAREVLPSAKIAVLRHHPDQAVPSGADQSFSTIDQALAFAPQMAVIANPANFHLSVAIPLARAGVHLLIEKPLSVSVKGVAELLDVCDAAQARLVTGYNLRYLSSLQQFKSLLDENVIGPVWSVRCETGQSLLNWRPGTDYRQGVSAQQALGGGALLELSHEFDYLRWIFGEVAWVQATLSKQSDFEIDVEDTVHLIMGFQAKSGENRLVASVNVDFMRQDTTRLCTAIGKLGSLRWNGVSGTVELFGSDAQCWKEVCRDKVVRDESYLAEWRDFVSAIEGSTQPLIGAEDGLEVLHIIDAVRLAASTASRTYVNRLHDL